MQTGALGFINETKANTDALSRLSGGLTSSSIEYAVTGSTKLNLARIHGTGVLELNIGESNNIFNLGTGGTDLSYGTLSQAYKGIGAYAQNRKIREAGVDRELRAAARTLYSAGMGETDQLYADILSGDAKLNMVTGKKYEGYTTLGSDGKRNISLNTDGKSALDLSVLLSHEAFRDGVTSDANSQQLETQKAAFYHMQVSAAINGQYGGNYLSEGNREEAEMFQNAVDTEDYSKVMAHLGDYVSEGDFWKIKSYADGTYSVAAEYDENGNLIKDVTFESFDENGNLKSSYSPEGQEYQNSLGQAASLGNAIGLDNAEMILGSDLNDADLYDTQTLKDVLKLSDKEIKMIQHSGSLQGLDMSKEQKLALAGEALLKKEGFSWDNDVNKWKTNVGENATNIGYKGLEVIGSSWKLGTLEVLPGDILGKVNSDGGFDYSTISAHVLRDTDSYKSSIGDATYQGLDHMYFMQQDLNGTVFNSEGYDGFQTVDILDNGKNNQPYKHSQYGDIQGNTIAPGSFWMQMGGSSDFPSEVWVIHDAVTIDDTAVGPDGDAIGEYKYDRTGRWLAHQNRNNDQNDDYGTDFDYLYVDGCFGNSTTNWNKILNDLYGWGAFSGYDIKTQLHEYNY